MSHLEKKVIHSWKVPLFYGTSCAIQGLDDWDFVGLNDFNANIRWFNVDSRSIIATVNQTAGKAASALNKAISIRSILSVVFRVYTFSFCRLDVWRKWTTLFKAGWWWGYEKISWFGRTSHLCQRTTSSDFRRWCRTNVPKSCLASFTEYLSVEYHRSRTYWLLEVHRY